MQTYEIDDLATLRNVVTALIHAYKGNGIDPATVKTTPLTLYVRNSAKRYIKRLILFMKKQSKRQWKI